MKKKLTALLLCMTLALCAGACAKTGEGPGEKTGPETLDTARATETIGACVTAFKKKAKATATFRMDETVSPAKGETPTSRDLSETKFFYDTDNQKFAATGAYDYYGGGEVKEPVLTPDNLYYAAGEGDAFTQYDITFNDDGTVDPQMSEKGPASKALVSANMYGFGGSWSDYEVGMMQLYAMGALDLGSAVLENGAVTFDKDVQGDLLLDSIYANESVNYHVSMRLLTTGTGEFTLTVDCTEADKYSKTVCSVKFEDGVEMPTTDLSAVTATTTYPVSEFAGMMGELTEMYGTVKVTDGAHETKQCSHYLDNGSVWIQQNEQATVYLYSRNDQVKTYFDFTDASKQDVYYEGYHQQAEDIGTVLDSGSWYDYTVDADLAYAPNILTFSKTGSTVVMFVNPFGWVEKIETRHGVDKLTETYSYGYELTVPDDSFFESFTLKTA